jgi:predicted nuclease of predicted toxin-antitoxin system
VNFKTDENLPLEVALLFREEGFDCTTVWDEALEGASDETISERVREETRVLLTLDLDFANIRAYPPGEHVGIIVLRPPTQDKATVLAYVRNLVQALRHRNPSGELWIVQRDRIRFRGSH